MEKLQQIAKKILIANPDAMLSGSLAMQLRFIKTRREPKDIDIFLPDGCGFIKIDGMKDSIEHISQSRVVSGTIRQSYSIEGIQVDVMTPTDENFQVAWEFVNGLKLLTAEQILKFKLDYAFDNNYPEGQQKHIEDIIFILQNRLKNGIEDYFDKNPFDLL